MTKWYIWAEVDHLMQFLKNNDFTRTLHALQQDSGRKKKRERDPSFQIQEDVDYMSTSYKDIIFAIMRILRRNGFEDTLHALEEESGVIFKMNELLKMLVAGKWNEAELYLTGFIQPEDSLNSCKIFDRLLKQQNLDASSSFHTERAELHYRRTTRAEMAAEIKQLIEADPDIVGKRKFSRLEADIRNLRLRKNFCPQHNSAGNPQVEADTIINGNRTFSDMDDSRLQPLSQQRVQESYQQHSRRYIRVEIPQVEAYSLISCKRKTEFQYHPRCNLPIENQIVVHISMNPENRTSKFINNMRRSENSARPGINLLELCLPRIRVKRRKPNFTVLTHPSQLGLIRNTNTSCLKITSLTFAKSGTSLLAVAENGHVFWSWDNRPNKNVTKATKTVACIDDNRAILVAGGNISLFSIESMTMMSAVIMSPPPTATCAVCLPLENNNVIAVGYDDNSIHIYDYQKRQLIKKLVGHSESITSLASSADLNVLVSAGADSQLVLWGMKPWEKQRSCSVYSTRRKTMTRTRVEFCPNGTRLLVIHDLFLAIYDGSVLKCDCKWEAGNIPHTITEAAFSARGYLVFGIFSDCVIGIFLTKDLQLLSLVKPEAYLPNAPSLALSAVAGNPMDPNMVAVGLSDGKIVLLEPLPEVGLNWIGD